MSLYNMINGVNQATFFILPMLGKHPEEYPRFRDCWVNEGRIEIFTRAGGGNREGYEEEIEELQNMEGYVTDYDDDFDSTYATFVFEVPKQYKEDFDKIMNGKLLDISDTYKAKMYEVYPNLKERLDTIFDKEKAPAQS